MEQIKALTPETANVDRAEQNKVFLIRSFVEKLDPLSKDVDDFTLRWILRARDLNTDKATNKFLKCMEWRRSFVPNGFISASEIPNQLAQNKFFVQGSDKKGRPIGIYFKARHFHIKGGLEEFKRFVVFMLDKLCSRGTAEQDKFTIIVDLEGWGYSNCDTSVYLSALSILQDYYPDRLGKAFVIHAPYIFMAVWKVIYPFINDKTKKKIVIVENKKLKATLLEEIDENQLPEIYGGKLKLVPVQDT